MEDLLFNSFSQVYPLSIEDFKTFMQSFKRESYRKGDEILSFGQIENRTSMVLSGMVHQTVIIGGEIFTVDISLSGMYFNNLKSYLEESPSIEVQTALTDVDILFIEKEAAERLRHENHAFCYIYSKSWEKTHLEREKRSYMLQNKNAIKRFELFMSTNENAKRYLEEVPQRIIAEYLNLTPETLSRVKKEYFRKS
ncbi:Crp/Fnr family transcriptional regulator [Flagellimonas pacifica]|uniref:cAMP-binding domain of CRP or a regulatory subunit of cAMP-dependent protein kinases n=1 Tax=Flagellimonas pacifica TaxID=1247520 RepID=A0A285MS79_9FLAO|nr:Crp/Fnr family transcriptional regulator [Allomuricauda parva]SNZ00030.1 cAMP-binding domain of CRP or a regulatory subunit of cAMP-dependent protein kinases [Allomuricauda parva]